MPTYQYACTACDHRFEAVQSFSDASLTVCPTCTGALRKVFSSVGIVFKGSGFYRTDSRSGPGSTVANGASNGEAKSETKSGEATSGSSSTAKGESSTSGGSASKNGSSSSGAPAAAATS
ncbi:FmdB family zinc ribbon protein [Pseudonocardia sp.]|uniref:FmdB family zinc ribbon protein n=1 Tax=Pseudonocardia sp. TaxID=60912 RepID=UPI002621C866|nr:FmdB family zinc ribbon protein [Pseudonocardia sp.]